MCMRKGEGEVGTGIGLCEQVKSIKKIKHLHLSQAFLYSSLFIVVSHPFSVICIIHTFSFKRYILPLCIASDTPFNGRFYIGIGVLSIDS